MGKRGLVTKAMLHNFAKYRLTGIEKSLRLLGNSEKEGLSTRQKEYIRQAAGCISNVVHNWDRKEIY